MSSYPRESDDLRQLTRTLMEVGAKKYGGVLGGEFGYGTEFKNDVFEMHPYYWGDCECGFDEKSREWREANRHTADCYQTAVDNLRDDDITPITVEALGKLADEWGLPRFGSAMHCTCGQDEKWQAWIGENDHDPACSLVIPNFRHIKTGVEVRWYKYIGRGMEFNRDVDRNEWNTLIDECLASIE